jgi:prevent-host-death family protein
MSESVDVTSVATELSRMLERVQTGEEFTITKDGHPVARLTAIQPRPKRRVPGMDKGVVIYPNFDDPLPEFDPDYMHPEDPMRDMVK